jgi:NAD+ kinase
MHLTKNHITGIDMIISYGGDGTFLRCASVVEDSTPILGVDSDPGTREGFFTRTNCMNFTKDFVKKKTFVSVHRLEAWINGKPWSRLALNEFLITTEEPYHTATYEIDDEFQKSSGVLVGTGAGSTAWIKSAGGKKLPLRSKNFQYVVREPYYGKRTGPTKVKKLLSHTGCLRIVSKMNGILVADSSNEVRQFDHGDVVEIKMSSKPIQFVDL